jgi:hypothetical protein
VCWFVEGPLVELVIVATLPPFRRVLSCCGVNVRVWSWGFVPSTGTVNVSGVPELMVASRVARASPAIGR